MMLLLRQRRLLLRRESRRGISASEPFDRVAKGRQRAVGLGEEYQYLRSQVAKRLVSRLRDISSLRRFPKMLDVGCHTGHIQRALIEEGLAGEVIDELQQCDFSREAIERGKEL